MSSERTTNMDSLRPTDFASSSASSLSSSRFSDASSGVWSQGSGSSSGADDSLTRAFLELRLRETEGDGGSCDDRAGDQEPAAESTGCSEFQLNSAAKDGDREDDDEGWEAETVIPRCSSLKSCGVSTRKAKRSPRAKKAVRFADSMGLDLVRVRHIFSNPDAAPEVDGSLRHLGPGAPAHHHHCQVPKPSLTFECLRRRPHRPRLLISPCFAQPGDCAGFLSRVMSQKVMLERASVASVSEGDGRDGGLSGIIRVCNLHFEKRVTVRVTFDAWLSCSEVQATYKAPEYLGAVHDGGMTDRFVFSVRLPSGFGSVLGNRVAFCVSFEAAGQTYWDSNYGENYAFDCLPISWSSPLGSESFASFS